MDEAHQLEQIEDKENPGEEVDIETFPGFSTYSTFCHCCHKMSDGSIFCGHWECNPGMPIVVIALILANLGILYWLPFFVLGLAGKIFIPIITLFAFMFIFCYIKTIYDGPGYIPYYYHWVIQDKLPKADDPTVNFLDDSLAGVITNKAQYKCAHDNVNPGRSIVSKLGRRFVIRPDHFCGWVGCWIGKRNHKMFILFNIYGSIFLGLSLLAHILSVVYIVADKFHYTIFIEILFILMSLLFTFMTCQFAFMHCIAARKNRTSWEEWNDIKYGFEHETAAENFAEVFGYDQNCCQIICPTNPWKGYSSYDLVKDLPTYQQIKQNQNLTAD